MRLRIIVYRSLRNLYDPNMDRGRDTMAARITSAMLPCRLSKEYQMRDTVRSCQLLTENPLRLQRCISFRCKAKHLPTETA